MAAEVNFKKGKLEKKAPVGFSWTTFFFGPIVAFFRGDIKWGCIMLGCGLFTSGLSNIAFAFFYNKTYIEGLIKDNWEPVSETDITVMKSSGLSYDDE